MRSYDLNFITKSYVHICFCNIQYAIISSNVRKSKLKPEFWVINTFQQCSPFLGHSFRFCDQLSTQGHLFVVLRLVMVHKLEFYNHYQNNQLNGYEWHHTHFATNKHWATSELCRSWSCQKKVGANASRRDQNVLLLNISLKM